MLVTPDGLKRLFRLDGNLKDEASEGKDLVPTGSSIGFEESSVPYGSDRALTANEVSNIYDNNNALSVLTPKINFHKSEFVSNNAKIIESKGSPKRRTVEEIDFTIPLLEATYVSENEPEKKFSRKRIHFGG